VLGNDVQGGKVYHKIGSLDKASLEDNRDLPVTTDFRSVFGAVAKKHLNVVDTAKLFPGYEGDMLYL
jgi:uncharacterized protein (DUF1501 family)